MRDALQLTKIGIANLQIMTQAWWDVCETSVELTDSPGLPAVEVPNPMAGKSDEQMREVAERILPGIIDVFEGRVQQVRWEEDG